MRGRIPVYWSRHQTPLPVGYGAFIDWREGETVIVGSTKGLPNEIAFIDSGAMWHDEAPLISGARGAGQWVREVVMANGYRMAVPEHLIYFAK